MKSLRKITLLALAAVALAACDNDEPTADPAIAAGQPLVLTANFPVSTRATVDNYWDGGETVCVQVIEDYTGGTPAWENAEILSCSISTENQLTIVFPAGKEIYWEHDDDPKLIRAWYCRDYTQYPFPVLEELPTEWNVQTTQYLYPNDNYPYYWRSDFVFAQKLATFNESIKNGVGLTFYHQVAKVVVNIYGQPLKAQNLTVSYVYLNFATLFNASYSYVPPAKPSDGYYGEWTKPSGNTSLDDIIMKPATANTGVDFGSETGTQDADFTFEALVIPQTTSRDYPLDIRIFVESDDGYDDIWSYEFASPVTWKAGHVYTYNLTLTPSGLKLGSIDANIIWDTTGATGSGEAIL